MYRINSVHQAERLPLFQGYKELVRQDSSLIPLESCQFQEDDEIVGMMVNMIQKDMIWHNEHHQQAISKLVFLQNKYSIKELNEVSIMEKAQTVK